MSHAEKNSLTRRELLKTAGKATAVVVASPLVELALGGDGVLSAQALPPAAFNAVAGPDRVVMRDGKTYLNGWTGVGQQPRRQRLRGGPAPPAAPPPPPPPGPAPAVAWSQVSGPGTVTLRRPEGAGDDGPVLGAGRIRRPDGGRQRYGESDLDPHREGGAAAAARAAPFRGHAALRGDGPVLGAPGQGPDHLVDSVLHRPVQPHRHPRRARRRRHRQLRRGREGLARRTVRRAQGLRLLERVGAPDGRVHLPGVDDRPAGRSGDHRGAEEAARVARGLDPEDPGRAASRRLPADGVHAARRAAPRPAGRRRAGTLAGAVVRVPPGESRGLRRRLLHRGGDQPLRDVGRQGSPPVRRGQEALPTAGRITSAPRRSRRGTTGTSRWSRLSSGSAAS